MKKYIAILISLVTVLGLCACGSKDTDKNRDTEKENTKIESSVNKEDEEIVEDEKSEKWGVQENIITEKDSAKARAHIKFPYLAGITEGQGKIAYQTDKTLVVLGSEIDFEEPDVEGDKIDNVFPAYFQKVNGIFKTYRRANYQNFEFNISEKKLLNINDYEMCKFNGEHTFTLDGQSKSITYVAYATKLKTNGAIVYWMVLDESEDQSLGSTIESHAKKMAESLYE